MAAAQGVNPGVAFGDASGTVTTLLDLDDEDMGHDDNASDMSF